MGNDRPLGRPPRLAAPPALAPPSARKATAPRPAANRPAASPGLEPTILLVGADSGLEPALRTALMRHRVYVETAEAATVAETVIATAPDLVVLSGQAARDGGREILLALLRSPVCSVVPVAILDDNAQLDARLSAFRHGAAAVIPRSASMDAIAEQIAQLAREIPERGGEALGHIGEATLGELVDALSKQLRSGILSVHGGGDAPDQPAVRLVLGKGRPLAAFIDDFVRQVKRHVVRAEPLHYEFTEHAAGTVRLLDPEFGETTDAAPSIRGLRVALADDDAARADSVAQELRARGVTVVVTDLAPSEPRFLKLRQVDPQVLIIGEAHLQGKGYELMRRMRRDTRLRWQSLLVVRWEEIWSDSLSVPALDRLESALGPLAEGDRSLRERAQAGDAFDARLETTGPARGLRALLESARTLRVTIQNPRLSTIIDLSEGLLVGARAEVPGDPAACFEGPTALSALMVLSSGRVHVEPVSQPAATNLMATIDVALNMADSEPSPIAPSIPSPPRESLRPSAGPARASLPAPAAGAAQAVSPSLAPVTPSLAPPKAARSRFAWWSFSRQGVSWPTALVLTGLAALQGLLVVVVYGALARKAAREPPPVSASVLTPAAEMHPGSAVASGNPAAPEQPEVTPTGREPDAIDVSPAGTPAAVEVSPQASPSSGKELRDESGHIAPTCDELARGEPTAESGSASEAYRQMAAANRYLVTGDLDAAQRALCKAVRGETKNAAIPTTLSQVLLMRRDGVSAVHWAENALERDPSNSAARAALADGLARVGELDAARRALLLSAGIESATPEQIQLLVRNSLHEASAAFTRRDLPRSERYFRRAVVLDRDNLPAYLGLVNTLLRASEDRAARIWADRAVALAPESAAARVVLGDVLDGQHDRAGAEAAWNAALQIDPKNRLARHRLAKTAH